MSLSAEAKQALAATIAGWFRNFGGTSALDVASHLSMDHADVMRIFEQLAETGHGSLNRSVQLYLVSFDPNNIEAGSKHEPVVTHIFFPSKEALRNAFFSSELPKQRLPEYKTRMHLGTQQIELIFFNEEVLSRYLDHPEHYAINDSLAGGEVESLSEAPEDRFLYVRYGKCRLKSLQIAVTAICKDLADMSPSEQRYWHSYEIDSPALDKSDTHFHDFVKRTYEGDFVDFHDPIAELLAAIARTNDALGSPTFFTKLNNVHLRLPVEQTYKSYCDAASELYKVLGPDSLSQARLKSILLSTFSASEAELVHAKSGRPLSTLQLTELLEQKLGAPGLYTIPLRKLSSLRVKADHKVLEPDTRTKSYSREFGSLCDQFTEALDALIELLTHRIK